MARMIPSQPVGRVSPEVATAFRRLKQMPGDDCVCCLSLPLNDEIRPEFLVIYKERKAFLLSVSPVSAEAAESVIQQSLFSDDSDQLTPASFGLREIGVLETFSENVAAELGLGDRPIESLERAILFPHVPQSILERIRQIRPSDGLEFWGKENLSTLALHKRFSKHDPGEDDCGSLIQVLRTHFSPEVRIPKPMVGRSHAKRDLAAGLTSHLLDLDQEMITKLDLALSPEAEETVSEIRTRLITGVAGSGKSLVLLYRAMLLARIHPGSRLLILTHNRPLRGDLHDRFNRIAPDSKVDWGTFYQWCHVRLRSHWREILKPWERNALIEQILDETKATGLAFTTEFILEEIDWLKDHGIINLLDYLTTPRTGRGYALQENQRRTIFQIYKKYQQQLVDRKIDDWSNIPLRFLHLIDNKELQLPLYDFIFVDEAQFFAPVWFEIVQRAVRPETGQLFLAADPTQGFLKRRISWAGSGLNVRGRTTRLQHSYRNTREILSFAARFYKSRLPEDDEEINLPEADDWNRLPHGPEPQFIELNAAQDVISRTANEILESIEIGFPPGQILVLVAASKVDQTIERLLNAINRTGTFAINVQKTFDSTKVKICSLNAGTGLESPVVFLVGLDSLLEREEDLRLSPGEKEEILRDNTRRIYMGMTRASHFLAIVTTRPQTREILAPDAVAGGAEIVAEQSIHPR